MNKEPFWVNFSSIKTEKFNLEMIIAFTNKILECINEPDKHAPFRKEGTEISLKRKIIEEIIVNRQTFYEIKRKARQEMLGIDGVTILDDRGKIITSGAIIFQLLYHIVSIPSKIKGSRQNLLVAFVV